MAVQKDTRRPQFRRGPFHNDPATIPQILRWADSHRGRTGEWPHVNSGAIRELSGLTWDTVRCRLRKGIFGLSGGSSLRLLLARHRGVHYDRRYVRGRTLTLRQVQTWAREHQRRTGVWPMCHGGVIPNSNGETWQAIDLALRHGFRGLPKGRSLAKFLGKENGSIRRVNRPPFTIRKIITWVDAHRQRTGRWPKITSGPIVGAPGETWQAVQAALKSGWRGLPKKGLTLARVLKKYRGVRYPLRRMTPLSIRQILEWADDHFQRTGDWPSQHDGKVAAALGETWRAIQSALQNAARGLPRSGWTLARLLARYRGRRNPGRLPKLTVSQILNWADDHHRRTGRWPNGWSGPIPGAAGETWRKVCDALNRRRRGLRGPSLRSILAKHRGVVKKQTKRSITMEMILGWAQNYYQRHNKWPMSRSGPVKESDGVTWNAINSALVHGTRGLRGGTTLFRLLSGWGGPIRTPPRKRDLAVSDILLWAKAHARRYGEWPNKWSGKVDDAPLETWLAIDLALNAGVRGLKGRRSLASLLARQPLPRQRKLKYHDVRIN